MDVFIGKRVLVYAIVSVLGLCVSPVSIAANDIEINSGLPAVNFNIGELTTGDFTSTGDSAVLKDGSITSAWGNGDAVTVTTTNSGADLQAGNITVNTILDFNTYGSSSLTLNALNDININFDILDSDTNSVDSLTLNLNPTGVVNLNATIGQSTNTTVNGALAIGDSGIYNLINASDSLTVDSITKTTSGTFNYSAGSLTINSLLNIDSSGVLGRAFVLGSTQNLHTASQSVGTLDASSVTQNAGTNTVDGELLVDAGSSYTLTDGDLLANSIAVAGGFTQTGGTNTVATTINISDVGSYALSGGSLTADDITRASTGVFTYIGGDLTLNSGALAIETSGLLGATVSLDATQNLHTASQSIGAGGSLTQTGGTNVVDGALTINAGGSYTLDTTSGGSLIANSIANDGVMDVTGTFTIDNGNSYTQSGNLTADDISANGSLTQTAGDTTVTNAINVSSTGAYTLNGGALTSNTLSTDGAFIQGGGANTVNGVLNVHANGSYTMNGGNLKASSIVNNGAFTYTNGGVLLTNSAIDINSNALLGSALTIDAGEVFGATSMTVGDGAPDGGAVTQDAGSNTITNVLTVNNNGSYTLNGGDLSVGSLLVVDGGAFAGAGTVNASGDITDLRTSGVIDAGYTGANISLAADTMNGAINASESITLDSITVNGTVTGTAMTLNGGSTLTNDVNLKPYVLNNFYNHSVITSASGDNLISGNVSIAPLIVDRHLGTPETVDSASIDVDAGSLTIIGDVNSSLMDMTLNVASASSLSLQGNSTSTKNLSASVAAGASLLLGNTTTTSFYGSGTGSFEVNGALTTSGAGAQGNVTIQGGGLSISGANGVITADGAAIIVGTNATSINTAQLTIDNSVITNSNRIGDNTDVQLSTGSTLTLNGPATGSVTEKAGSLIVNHLNEIYTSSRDFVSNVVVNGGTGTTQLTFDDLQLASPVGSEVNRIDFSTNGSFGSNERILFNTAPILVSDLMQNATINGQEFVTYDNTLGIKAATTATNNFVAAGNILINSSTNLAAGTTINSLAVTTANVTGTGELSLSSGQMLLSGTSVIDPSINFVATQGNVLVTGNSTLNGGVSGGNGMFVNGGGTLTLAGAGAMTGAVTVNSGNLVLAANDALQGADITYDGLDIGSTTQNVNSLSTGSGFSGTGSVIAANDISYTSTVGIVDANYQSLNGNVTVRADIMNGDINATYGSDTTFDPSKGVVRLGSTYQPTTVNGNTVASAVFVTGTVNGDIDASDRVNLYGTSNGVISGAANLTGSGALYGANAYTGSTSGTFTLRGNGSIANSSDYTGSLYMYSNDTESNLDRIGDSAQINLNGNGRTLNLIGSGTESTGISISEDVGVINVSDNSEVNINIDNSLNGSTTLTADSLALGSNSLVFLSLGDASQLKIDAAPATIGSTGIINGVYIEKDINGSMMPTWTTYKASNGVVEVAVAESSIASASAGDFIRVTDAVNSALTNNHTIGAMTVDTMETMSGSGSLTVASGQIQFWQDNTIDIAQINFGAEQAFLSNAGTNTINSALTGSNGLRKLGDGKIILGGANTYTGDTLITGGEIEVTGSLTNSGVIVSDGTGLTINGGNNQVAKILSNTGTVNLISASHSTLAGQNLSGYGSFSLDNASSLTNAGNTFQTVYNNGGVISNLNTGYIYAVTNAAGSLTSTGNIIHVSNASGATFTHNAGEVGYLSNSGIYAGSASSVIGSVSNNSSFTNLGTINDDISNTGTFVNNSNVSLDGTSSFYTYTDTLTNSSGASFTNNSAITVSQQGYVSLGGAFNNNGSLVLNNTVNGQSISGAFTNNSTGIVDVNGSTVNLSGTFTNKGSVNIDATSLVTGSGTYTQQGDNTATTVVDGRVETNVIINNGDLSGTGLIAGDLTVNAPGTISPGNSPGLMTIEGNFDLSGLLNLEVAFDDALNQLVFDSLAIGGDFNILGNGRINFDLGTGVDESIFTGDNPLLSLTDIFYGINEESDPLDLTSLLETTLNLNLANGDAFKLSLIDDGEGGFSTAVEAVPVPAAVWLFGSGLLGLIAVARKRA